MSAMEEGGGPPISSGMLSSIQSMGGGTGSGMQLGGDGQGLSVVFSTVSGSLGWVSDKIGKGSIAQKLEEMTDGLMESTAAKNLTFGLNTLTNAAFEKFAGLSSLSIISVSNIQGLGLGQFISPPTPVVAIEGKSQGQAK